MRRAGRLASKLGHSEYGGASGLVQPAKAPDGPRGHTPTPSEVSSAINRVPSSESAYDASPEAEIIEGDG